MGDAYLHDFDRDQDARRAPAERPEDLLAAYEQQRQHAAWTAYLRGLLTKGVDIRPMLAKGPPGAQADQAQQDNAQQAEAVRAQRAATEALAEAPAASAAPAKAVGAPGTGAAPSGPPAQ